MFSSIKVVQFENGKFGIRKGRFFHSFLDFDDYPNHHHWRRPGNTYFLSCCQTTDQQRAIGTWESLTATGNHRVILPIK